MENNRDIEKIFYSDCSQKKRVGNNISKRASRRGFIRGGVRTQYDFLNSKERKKLNGEVTIKYMYEEIGSIPSVEKLKKMDIAQAKKIVTIARNNFSNKQLMNHWGIRSAGSLYCFFEKVGVTEKKVYMSVEDRKERKMNQLEEIKKMIYEMGNMTHNSNINKENGFKINFSGKYDKSAISSKIKLIADILEEGKKYNVNITLEEVEDVEIPKSISMPEL